MKVELTKLFHILPFFLTAAARETDHRKLTRHIINLNQQNSTQGIIHEVSVCLKEILNYRLFAFVIQRDRGIDVWLDPRMYRKSLESVLMEDFRLHSDSAINYMNHTFHPDEKEQELTLESLVSYDMNEKNCQARIYMLPDRNTPSHHDEIVHMLLKSAGIALSKQINIDQLTDAATLDPLTGCYNRREFENQIKKAIASAKRHQLPLSLFMFDIDYFKKVNDTYGHQAGDEVLKEISKLMKENIRSNDMLARYGGEEFVAILPSTEKREAMELADRLRQKIENIVIKTTSHRIRITASFGVAGLAPSCKMPETAYMDSLIEEADSMMYKAKLNGRNTVMPGLIQISNTVLDKK